MNTLLDRYLDKAFLVIILTNLLVLIYIAILAALGSGDLVTNDLGSPTDQLMFIVLFGLIEYFTPIAIGNVLFNALYISNRPAGSKRMANILMLIVSAVFVAWAVIYNWPF